jgi:hypothetical protein
MAEELLYLTSPGSLPGLPGEHGAGSYLVDYAARTIRPASESEAAAEAPNPGGDGPEIAAVAGAQVVIEAQAPLTEVARGG